MQLHTHLPKLSREYSILNLTYVIQMQRDIRWNIDTVISKLIQDPVVRTFRKLNRFC